MRKNILKEMLTKSENPGRYFHTFYIENFSDEIKNLLFDF